MNIHRFLYTQAHLIRTLLVRTVASLFIFLGFVLFLTPIPVGIFLLLIGLALLIMESKTARNFFKHRRRLNPRIDQWVRRSSARSPAFLRKILDYTDPNLQ